MTRKHVGRAMAGLAIALPLLLSSGAATAQQQNRTYQDSMGRNTGRSVTDTRGNTTFYDAMGRNTGRSVSDGNNTIIYDSMGRRTGTIRAGDRSPSLLERPSTISKPHG